MTAPAPPAQLEPYVAVLGVDLAIAFFLAFGGAELYIPRDPKGRSRLVDVVGLDRAQALADLAERSVLPRRVPIGKPWIARVLKSQGLPIAKIATRLHTTDVTVRAYLKGDSRTRAYDLRRDPRQPDLF